MQINITVTNEELREMDLDAEALKAAILRHMDAGVDAGEEGTLYLAGFSVDVHIADDIARPGRPNLVERNGA